MKLKLPSSIDSPQALEAVRYDIEQLRAWLTDNAIRAKAGSKPAAEPPRTPQTDEVLTTYFAAKTPTVVKLTELLSELRSIKPMTVHVTLTTLPGRSLRQQLVEWFRSNCREDVLVSFTADRTIGGGIIIRTPNRMFDYSFRARLNEGRTKIPEILRHV